MKKILNQLIKSSYIRFLTGYIVIIISIIISYYPIYSITTTEVEENFKKDTKMLLDERISLLDSQLMYMNNIGIALRNDSSFAMLAYPGKSLISSDYYNVYEAQRFMKKVVIVPKLFDEVYFTYKNNPAIISKDFLFNSDSNFYGQQFYIEGMDKEKWNQYMQYNNTPAFKEEKTFVYIRNPLRISKKIIPFIVPTYNPDIFSFDSALYCFIPYENLQDLIIGDNISFKSLYLLDNNSKIIFSYSKNKSLKAKYNKGIEHTGIRSRESSLGVHIVAELEPQLFAKKIDNAMRLVTIFFVFSVIIGLALAFYLSFRSNKPLTNLKRSFQKIAPLKNTHVDVYKYFDDALTELDNVQNSYKEQIKVVEAQTKSNLFRELLENNQINEDNTNLLEEYFYYLKSPYIVGVILIKEKKYNRLDFTNNTYSKTLSVVISQILSENLTNIRYIYNVFKQKIVFIYTVGDEVNVCEERIAGELTGIANKIFDVTGEVVKISISNPGRSFADISECYDHAFNTSRLKFKLTEKPVIMYQKNEEQSRFFKTIKEWQHFYEIISAGNKQNVINFIDSAYNKMVKEPYLDDKIISQSYHNLANALIIFDKENKGINENALPDIKYSSEKTLDELFEGLKEYAEQLWNIKDHGKKEKDIKIIENFKAIIAEFYHDPNLSAAMIADKLNYSEKYLFAYVKGQTGKSVGDFIDEARMDAAKKLLLETPLSINDIGIRCGFYSQNSFYKAFKRYTGQSPVNYRRNQN